MPPGRGGKHWQTKNGYSIPLGPVGNMTPLAQLRDKIAECETAGLPVTVDWGVATLGPMEPHTQKLYATLGVLVRFV